MTDELPLLVAQLEATIEIAQERLVGLTDAEYLWEPAPGMWSIRPRGEAASSHPYGAGALLLDFNAPEPEPDPAPLTTIAWRLGHLIDDVAGRWEYTFGSRSADLRTFVDFPATASQALTDLTSWCERWRDGVASLTEAQAAEVGFGQYPWGLDPGLPIRDIVWWVNREVIHHLAEVALLRDLYRSLN